MGHDATDVAVVTIQIAEDNKKFQMSHEMINISKRSKDDQRLTVIRNSANRLLQEFRHFDLVELPAETKLSSKNCRKEQCTMGALIADIMVDYFAADAALIPGGKIRANKTYSKGIYFFFMLVISRIFYVFFLFLLFVCLGLTLLDINAELPFPDNFIYVTGFTGEELNNAIQFSQTGD